MYRQVKAGTIKPTGWLRRQLAIQAAGLSGHLDSIWPDVADSAWIGGKAEGWERVPYWLDGFIPLGFLLEDQAMIARAARYVEAILDRQQEDGWICPCERDKRGEYDLWALFLICKVLALYCEFTDSERVQTALYRALKNAYALYVRGEIRLFGWGESRYFECFIPLQYLYERFGEDWMLDFARRLQRDGADYEQFTERWMRPLNKWTQQTHIVNIAMMLKSEAVGCCLLGDSYEGRAERWWRLLEKTNGTAVGTFTGDECLSGIGNNHGTELCSVAELMYSCEILYAVTGKGIWADRLEKLAFNALPATISDDMWTHQYDQMVNQIACVKFPGRSQFRTNSGEAHLFGLEPNFGCCTANFNQAWPKLAMNAFLQGRDGIVCAMMLPATLQTDIHGTPVTVEMQTAYPFRHHCRYTVTAAKAVRFALYIRVPRWAKAVRVNGKTIKKAEKLCFDKVWNGSETIMVELESEPHLVPRPQGLKTAVYGPLIFALPIRAQWKRLEFVRDGVERVFPYCDYELYPQSEWRYGFADARLTVCEREGDDVPFSSVAPRVTLKATVARVDWDYADGFDTVAACVPRSRRALGAAEQTELVPYGGAKLRMTELPMTR